MVKMKRVFCPDRIIVIGAVVFLASFYFISRTANHAIDAVLYAWAAEVKDAYPFFHWHHLLYTPLIWALLRILRVFGYTGDAFPIAAGVSAVTAAGAAAFLYNTLRRLNVRRLPAITATAGAAFGAGWWYFAGEGEVLSIISFFLAGSLFILTGRNTLIKKSVLLAIWLVIGTAFHQTVALFVPVAVTFIHLIQGGKRKWVITVLPLVYLPLALGFYALIPTSYYGVSSFNEWTLWVTTYARWGDWGNLSWARAAEGIISFVNAFAAGPDPFDIYRQNKTLNLISRYLPACCVTMSTIVLWFIGWRRAISFERSWFIGAAIWVFWYHAFFTWWEPENVEWWIATTIPLWFTAGLACKQFKPATLWLVILLPALIWVNFNRLIYPATAPGKNDAEAAANAIARVVRPGDWVMMSHIDTAAWLNYRGPAGLKIIQPFNRTKPQDIAYFEDFVYRRADLLKKRGKEVFFTDYEWDEPSLKNKPWRVRMESTFFLMLRFGNPITEIRFPGRRSVILKYAGYDTNVKVVGVFDAMAGGPAVLDRTGDKAQFQVFLPEDREYVLAIQAHGTPAAKVWPKMAVSVNGREVGKVTVDARYRRFYELRLKLPAGPNFITVSFTNDYYDQLSGEDRGLVVERLVVYFRRN